jgi:hypothetical protein
VLVNEVVMDAAEFAVNVGGCLSPDVVGHARKVGWGKSILKGQESVKHG